MENKNNSGGIGSGFLLGLLIGVLLTLLVTTKKGREVLRDLLDKIIQKVSSIDESIEKAIHETELENDNDYIKADPVEVKQVIHTVSAEKVANEKGGKQEKTTKRLFFRRTHKK